MIGNDVVDLAVKKKKAIGNERVLDKILPKTITYYFCINPETMVWNLWSERRRI
jgi:hypothetical protein